MEKVLFSEEQRYNQWWLWVIMLLALFAVLVPFLYGIYSQEVLKKPFGDNPMSTAGLIVTGSFSVFIMIVAVLILYKLRLKIKITNEAFWFSYPPIINKWKKIVPEEIDKFAIRIYSANREFGGHGMKKRRKYGMSYTVSGNIGLQLYLKNGKKLLLGTQKKQAIEYAMAKMMQGENSG